LLFLFEEMRAICADATGLSALLEHMPAINKANLMFLLLVLICVEGSMALSQLLKPVVTKALSRLPISGEPRTNLSYHFNFTRTENPASKKKASEYGCPNVCFNTYFSANYCTGVVKNMHEKLLEIFQFCSFNSSGFAGRLTDGTAIRHARHRLVMFVQHRRLCARRVPPLDYK
jgi:hypothetical protein